MFEAVFLVISATNDKVLDGEMSTKWPFLAYVQVVALLGRGQWSRLDIFYN